LVLEDRQGIELNEELDAAREAGLASDQSGAFEGEIYLVDRRRRDAKEALKSASAGGLPLSCV
jgi:hypothetical protein